MHLDPGRTQVLSIHLPVVLGVVDEEDHQAGRELATMSVDLRRTT
jgi:hypothetical protein